VRKNVRNNVCKNVHKTRAARSNGEKGFIDMHKNLLSVVLIAFIAVIGIVAYVLFQGSEAESDIIERQKRPVSDASVEDRPAGPAEQAEDRERLAPGPGEQVPDDDAMPESYREALGILKGRVVETDLTPVPDIGVEIVGGEILDFIQDVNALMDETTGPLELRIDGTRTGADGTFELKNVYPRAFFALGVDLGGARPTARIIDRLPNPGEVVDLGDIVLEPCAVLIGKVVDDEGEPIAGARVRATLLPPVVFISGLQDYRDGCSFLLRFSSREWIIDPPPAMEQIVHFMPFPTTTTGPDGMFRLEGVRLGVMTLVIDRSEYVTSKKGPIQTAAGGERDVGTITLNRGVRLEGNVVDTFGDPVEGIEVRVGPIYGVSEFIVLQPPVQSNGEGKFLFDGAAPLSTFAAARRYPEDPWTVVGPFDPEFEPPTLTLPPAYGLRLAIRDNAGAPIDNGRIKFRQHRLEMNMLPFHPPITPTERMERKEGGIIHIKDLPPGDYELLVTAPGYGVTKEEITVKAEPVSIDVVLQPAYPAVVHVLTEKTKEPVEWAQVHTYHDEGRWMFSPTKLARSRTNGAGDANFGNLDPGDYKVNVSHPSYAITTGNLSVRADLDAGERNETVVFLKPGGIVEGIVHKGGSTHEAPYMIALNLERSDSIVAIQSPRLTATDHEGKFRVTNLNPGHWGVAVLKRVLDKDPLGLGEVMRAGPLMESDVDVASGETSKVVIDLGAKDAGPSARVTGRVLLNGAAAEGALVSTYKGRRYESTVTSTGRYDLGEVPAGERTISLSNLPGPMGHLDSRIRRSVDLAENVPLIVDFEIFTGSLSGRVVTEGDPTAVRGVRISLNDQKDETESGMSIRMSTVTDLDGTFSFESVPTGTYTVRARDQEYACPSVKDVEVFAGTRASDVVLTMVTPVTVKGTVQLSEDLVESRWLGLYIKTADEATDLTAWAQINRRTGDFETKELIPGYYRVTIVAQTDVEYKPMEFTVPAGGVTNLVIVPEPLDAGAEGGDK